MIETLGQTVRLTSIAIAGLVWAIAAYVGVSQWQDGTGETALIVGLGAAGLVIWLIGLMLHRLLSASTTPVD